MKTDVLCLLASRIDILTRMETAGLLENGRLTPKQA